MALLVLRLTGMLAWVLLRRLTHSVTHSGMVVLRNRLGLHVGPRLGHDMSHLAWRTHGARSRRIVARVGVAWVSRVA